MNNRQNQFKVGDWVIALKTSGKRDVSYKKNHAYRIIEIGGVTGNDWIRTRALKKKALINGWASEYFRPMYGSLEAAVLGIDLKEIVKKI